MSAAEQISPELMLWRAREYVERGWSVFPLYPGSKTPAVKWAEFQHRLPTDKELGDWFRDQPRNIGIVTGKLSGIDVIDCDSAAAIEKATELGLPGGPMVLTAKGAHFYFKHSGSRNSVRKFPGIDVRGEGGFVVAPPSVHATGHAYAWVGEYETLRPLPQWISDAQVKRNDIDAPAHQKTPLLKLYDGVSEGSRNDSLARLLGAWAASKLPMDAAYAFAKLWGLRCTPPLTDEREIRRTVESIYAAEERKKIAAAAGPLGVPASPPHNDILRVAELGDKVVSLYHTGLQPGVTTGWPSVNELYTVRKGEWTVITGMPGSGKSTWCDCLAVNIAEQHGWRFAVFSAENLPQEVHVTRLMEKYLDVPFSPGPTARMTPAEFDRAFQWVSEHFTYLNPPEDKQTVDSLIAIASKLIDSEQIDAVIIDPWNELDHSRPPQMTETEHISVSITKLRRLARSKNVHVFVVAHPKQMQRDKNGLYPVPTLYDIAGSAHWRNKADNGIVVAREFDFDSKGNLIDQHESSIVVQKIRFREVGKIGKTTLRFNQVTGRFMDRFGGYPK